MKNKLKDEIIKLTKKFPDTSTSREYIIRAEQDQLTRDENPCSHFCVYFAAFDISKKMVFIGHHKKSGLWLFNGGHIDKDETLEEALIREISEEWGVELNLDSIEDPKLITITDINKCNRQKCTKHYDIWYFVPVSKDSFNPEKEKLNTEFYEASWMTVLEARKLITDSSSLIALSVFEKIFQ